MDDASETYAEIFDQHVELYGRVGGLLQFAAPGGHERTGKHRQLSSKGPLRSRQDTRGHAIKTVRDREAPGSNPARTSF